jgi:hypothetical protein
MAAYGLYTHIASNRRRSVLLLGGLFLLVYVMVFAGALLAEVFAATANRPFDAYLTLAGAISPRPFPFATIGAAGIWIVIAYFFHQNIIDAVTGGHGRDAPGGAAALQPARKSVHLARHPDAEAEDRWTVPRSTPSPPVSTAEAVFDHGHNRPDECARRPRDGGRARA